MQSIIDDLLPSAITLIGKKTVIWENEDDPQPKIKGIYESYLSQFGPMANQIGIRSTLAVYFIKDGNQSKGDRKFILQLIFDLLRGHESLGFAINQKYECWIRKLLTCTEISEDEEALLLDASVALKRAIRTFYLTEK